MAGEGIFDSTVELLDKALDLRSRKLQVISSNIANAETPGYARLRMDFETALRQAAEASESGPAKTHPRHLPTGQGGDLQAVQARFRRETDQSGMGDRNTVSLDQEMVDLADNQIRYEAAIRMLAKKFNMLKTVISERA